MNIKSTTLIIICFIFILLNNAKGQFAIGFRLPSVSWIGDEGTTEDGRLTGFFSPSSGNGFGIQGDYIIKPRMKVSLMFEYIATLRVHTTSTENIGGALYDEYVNVNAPATMIRGDFQFAFTHNFLEKGLTFYGFGGFAFNQYSYTTNFGFTAASSGGGTKTYESPEQNRLYSGASFSMGLGLEYNFNFRTHLFLDMRYASGVQTNFKTINFNNGDFLPSIYHPGYISSSLGMRFMLGPKPE